MATESKSSLLTGGTVSEGDVVVSDVVEELDLILVEQQTSRNRMNRGVTPSLVEEAAILIQRFEEINVRLASKPFQAADFKVRPLLLVSFDPEGNKIDIMRSTYEMALVVGITTIITEESHGVVLCDMFGMVLHEFLGAVPESRNGVNVFVETKDKAVLLVVLDHNTEGVVVDVAVKVNGRLDTPVVFVVHHQGVAEEKARLESTHVAVADRVTVDDLSLLHILAHLLGLFLINPLRERPVLVRNFAVVCLARHERRRDLLESRVERLVIEEDPVVVESSVEAVFNLAD